MLGWHTHTAAAQALTSLFGKLHKLLVSFLLPKNILRWLEALDNVVGVELCHPVEHLVTPLLVQGNDEHSAATCDCVAQQVTSLGVCHQHVELGLSKVLRQDSDIPVKAAENRLPAVARRDMGGLSTTACKTVLKTANISNMTPIGKPRMSTLYTESGSHDMTCNGNLPSEMSTGPTGFNLITTLMQHHHDTEDSSGLTVCSSCLASARFPMQHQV